MYKYLIKNFVREPFFNQYIDKSVMTNLPLCVYCSRLIEVPINSTSPKPYILREAKKMEDVPNQQFELSLNIKF